MRFLRSRSINSMAGGLNGALCNLRCLTWLLGGRQFARLWHFAGMFALIAFMFVHVFQVATQGFLNQMNSMITGRYRLDSRES